MQLLQFSGQKNLSLVMKMIFRKPTKSACTHTRVFHKRHFEKKIKILTQYVTGGHLGRIYPEGEDDLSSLGAYLIFVIFFTLANFEAWKFYTQKCVNLQQKLPRDTLCKIKYCLKVHIVCTIVHCV